MRLAIILVAIPVIALALFGSSTPPSASAQPTPVCGSAAAPVSHWIDSCTPGGTDALANTGAVVGIDTDGDCLKDANIVMFGPTDVVRQARSDDSAVFPGTRPVDSHLDVIDTEIVSMSLTGGGFGLKVGVSAPGINAGVPKSSGVIAEDPGDPTTGQSFFDVFFEITDPSSTKLYNHSVLQITADILQVPPDAIYLHPTGLCLDLFTDPVAGVDTGVNLVEAQHDPDPPPVGGIALVDSSHSPASPADGSGSSAGLYAALAGVVAAGALALAAGGWYARRRFRR